MHDGVAEGIAVVEDVVAGVRVLALKHVGHDHVEAAGGHAAHLVLVGRAAFADDHRHEHQHRGVLQLALGIDAVGLDVTVIGRYVDLAADQPGHGHGGVAQGHAVDARLFGDLGTDPAEIIAEDPHGLAGRGRLRHARAEGRPGRLAERDSGQRKGSDGGGAADQDVAHGLADHCCSLERLMRLARLGARLRKSPAEFVGTISAPIKGRPSPL